jgi:hypothetical protein
MQNGNEQHNTGSGNTQHLDGIADCGVQMPKRSRTRKILSTNHSKEHTQQYSYFLNESFRTIPLFA